MLTLVVRAGQTPDTMAGTVTSRLELPLVLSHQSHISSCFMRGVRLRAAAASCRMSSPVPTRPCFTPISLFHPCTRSQYEYKSLPLLCMNPAVESWFDLFFNPTGHYVGLHFTGWWCWPALKNQTKEKRCKAPGPCLNFTTHSLVLVSVSASSQLSSSQQ